MEKLRERARTLDVQAQEIEEDLGLAYDALTEALNELRRTDPEASPIHYALWKHVRWCRDTDEALEWSGIKDYESPSSPGSPTMINGAGGTGAADSHPPGFGLDRSVSG